MDIEKFTPMCIHTLAAKESKRDAKRERESEKSAKELEIGKKEHWKMRDKKINSRFWLRA